MKIVFFSDTHGKEYQMKLPEADIAICCGDISPNGKKWQIKDFMEWFSEQPCKHKVMIAGNHDFWFDKNHVRNTDLHGADPRSLVPDDIIYLEDETVEIEGVKIFGSPWTPWFHDWAFNAHRGEPMKKHWDLIEEGTDIIISHGPMSGTHLERCTGGDMVGCADLSARVKEIEPKICAFGHIHEAYGIDTKEMVDFDNYDVPGKLVTLINCSVLNRSYEMTNLPVIVDWDEVCEKYENKKEEDEGDKQEEV